MSEHVDPYTDPQTGILRNRIGARTQAALDQAEGGLSVAPARRAGGSLPGATQR